MVSAIRRVEQSKGTFVDGYYEAEEKAFMYARKSIVAKVEISKGTIITENMLTCKRPGSGIYPKHIDKFVGSKTIVDIKADTTLTFEMIG